MNEFVLVTWDDDIQFFMVISKEKYLKIHHGDRKDYFRLNKSSKTEQAKQVLDNFVV